MTRTWLRWACTSGWRAGLVASVVACSADGTSGNRADPDAASPVWSAANTGFTYEFTAAHSFNPGDDGSCGQTTETYQYIVQTRTLSVVGCVYGVPVNTAVTLSESDASALIAWLSALVPATPIDCGPDMSSEVLSLQANVAPKTPGSTEYEPACLNAGSGPYVASTTLDQLQNLLDADLAGCGKVVDAGGPCSATGGDAASP
jgi:hypothetical protein